MQNVGGYARAPTFQMQRWRVKASALVPNCRRFDTSRRKRLSSRHLGRHARDAALDSPDVCPAQRLVKFRFPVCYHRSCSIFSPSAAAIFSSVALRGCLTRSI